MFRYKKIRKVIPEKHIVTGFLGTLIILLIISMVIRNRENNRNKPPTPEEIIKYAESFLTGNPKEAYGTKLDCSGFTKVVFNKFSIHLPSSSGGQFKKTQHLSKNALEPGNLVFFNIYGKGVSHVGIYLDSSRFIHSPGKGKNICIDSLEQLYWNKRFICGGKIIFESQ